MPIQLTQKQSIFLRAIVLTAVVYLVFQYLLPLMLPFIVAWLLALLIRPAVRFLYKKFRIPMGIGAGLVLAVVLAALVAVGYYVGLLAVDQLIQLGQQLPVWWEQIGQWLWDCCGQVEESLHLADGAITEGVQRMMAEEGESLMTLVENSIQGAAGLLKGLVSGIVVIFVTIGATLITTTQLEEIRKAGDRSLLGQEIRRVGDTLARVGVAYGKTQLVIMGCTVIISAVGLSILGNSYALLWAVVIGLVDALPLFGAGTILWPWLALSLFRGQWVMAIGLGSIYGISNLLRQWMEARYMGDRIGLSALENLIAMYLGLQLFGVLGLFLGPVGYLLIKESVRDNTEGDEKTRAGVNSGTKKQ